MTDLQKAFYTLHEAAREAERQTLLETRRLVCNDRVLGANRQLVADLERLEGVDKHRRELVRAAAKRFEVFVDHLIRDLGEPGGTARREIGELRDMFALASDKIGEVVISSSSSPLETTEEVHIGSAR